MSKWNKQTYQEYLNDPQRLSLDREMAILRNLQDMEIDILAEEAPTVNDPKDVPFFKAWSAMREKSLKSLRMITQAYKTIVSAEHKKQMSSNLIVKIDVNFISQLVQIIMSEIPDIELRKRISSRISSFATSRQISSEDTVPEEDPTLNFERELPPPLSKLNEEPISGKRKYKMLNLP